MMGGLHEKGLFWPFCFPQPRSEAKTSENQKKTKNLLVFLRFERCPTPSSPTRPLTNQKVIRRSHSRRTVLHRRRRPRPLAVEEYETIWFNCRQLEQSIVFIQSMPHV
ncbi:hypothetical protein E1A91_D05G301900v1 [Gossypium mustelinum]|uniref:Uncharacterized protein n=1 Tax=Gossypium mustelinum TaxID=34275 RepID=A0A5D2V2R5_GOSMU|nr:hypothetical protein E1A91_D05G301900v1 [Gossypium mustelinum]